MDFEKFERKDRFQMEETDQQEYWGRNIMVLVILKKYLIKQTI